jgi:hypothetical protein
MLDLRPFSSSNPTSTAPRILFRETFLGAAMAVTDTSRNHRFGKGQSFTVTGRRRKDRSMPLLRIDVIKGRSEAELKELLDAIHRAMLAAFKVPERDRDQIVHEERGAKQTP